MFPRSWLTVSITCLYLITVRGNYYHGNPEIRQVPAVGDPGPPLILTPLIEAGDIQQARNASRVGSIDQTLDLESYSGFFTVDKKYDSNMFFWYFPAESLLRGKLVRMAFGQGGVVGGTVDK
uniref:Uncharacterized protein n=1 Tax=Timema shepardi TaxID=629360 RepID=A0A7R9B3F3_TIMSH|nr:unnamed protein product [Timema shepardi]